MATTVATKEAALNALIAAKAGEAQAQAAYNAADPTGAQQAKVASDQTEIQQYIADRNGALTQALAESKRVGLYLRNLTDAVGPGTAYVSNLQQQADDLTNQQLKLGQKIRTQRRAFMDQYPQSGTGGYFFHHTADDFALFVFFIGFVLVFYMTYSKYVSSSSMPMRLGGIFLFLFAWSAVVQLILRFG